MTDVRFDLALSVASRHLYGSYLVKQAEAELGQFGNTPPAPEGAAKASEPIMQRLKKALTSQPAKMVGLGVGGAALGFGAGHLIRKLKDKGTSPKAGKEKKAATEKILDDLRAKMAVSPPNKKEPMPTNPGPAYPSVEAAKKSKVVINMPMLGKSASAEPFRRLADTFKPY